MQNSSDKCLHAGHVGPSAGFSFPGTVPVGHLRKPYCQVNLITLCSSHLTAGPKEHQRRWSHPTPLPTPPTPRKQSLLCLLESVSALCLVSFTQRFMHVAVYKLCQFLLLWASTSAPIMIFSIPVLLGPGLVFSV